MTAAVPGKPSAPSPVSTSGPVAVAGLMMQAQLDLATEWRFWCLLCHRDGRVFAGRVGELRMFGITMVRLDVPTQPTATTYVFNATAVDDILVASENEARQAATILGDHDLLLDLVERLAAQGKAAEADNEPF